MTIHISIQLAWFLVGFATASIFWWGLVIWYSFASKKGKNKSE